MQSDAGVRANREAIGALVARQQVLDDEVGILADAMHEATLGGGGILMPKVPRPSAAAIFGVGGGGGGEGGGGEGGGGLPFANIIRTPTAAAAAMAAAAAAVAPPPILSSGGFERSPQRQAAASRLVEAQRRLDYEAALAAARSADRQRTSA